jgi:penicillin-binding protein 2
VETSAGGRPVRRLSSEPASPGNTVRLSIDIRLQALVEEMYRRPPRRAGGHRPAHRRGAGLRVQAHLRPQPVRRRHRPGELAELNESIDKPLLNRALRGTYPPGSTYKPFMAMAALNTGKRTPGQITMDGGYFHVRQPHASAATATRAGGGGHGRSIVKSSNVYYYSLASEMGVDLIHESARALQLRSQDRHRPGG